MTMEPQKASPISKMDGIRLQSTLLPFWTCISTSGIVKMMMKNVASKSNLALIWNDMVLQGLIGIHTLC